MIKWSEVQAEEFNNYSNRLKSHSFWVLQCAVQKEITQHSIVI